MDVKKMNFKEFKEIEKEGLVFAGTGGDLNHWVDGISKELKEDGMTTSDIPEEIFEEIIALVTTGGRNDLIFILKEDQVDYGKLAMWKIKWCVERGHCTWISDYKINYANQH